MRSLHRISYCKFHFYQYLSASLEKVPKYHPTLEEYDN